MTADRRRHALNIDPDGNLLNFSRSWPIPNIQVADRDYFKALKADPNLETFISAPVPNRADGTWDIYVRGASPE